MKVFVVEADQWGLRLSTHHKFEMAGKNQYEVFEAVCNRWPDAYNIKVTEKEEQNNDRRKDENIFDNLPEWKRAKDHSARNLESNVRPSSKRPK